MRMLVAGVSALALLTAAACKEEAETGDSSSTSSASIEKAVSADAMKSFKAKDYGETDAVLGALALTGTGNDMVVFDSLSSDKGVTTLSNVKFTLENGDDDSVEFQAASMVFEGLHMTEAGSAFDRLTLKDVQPVDLPEGAGFNIGEVVVFEPNDATAAVISKLVAGQDVESFPSFSDMAFARMSVSDISIDMDAAKMDEGDEGKFTFALDEFSINNLAETIAGGALLDGFNMSFDIPQSEADTPFPIKGHFKVDEMSFAGLQAAFIDDVAGAVSDGGADEEAMAEMMTAINSRYLDKSPIEQGFDKAFVKGIDVDISGLSVLMDKAETIVERNADGAATKVKSPMSTIAVKLDAEAGELGAMAAEQLGKLGYDEIVMSMGGDATYDPATDLTRYDGFELDIQDAISIKFDGGFANITDFLKNMNSAQADGGAPDMSSAQNITINDFALTLEDKSLLDRAFKFAAEMQGTEPAQLRAMATGMLGMATMQAGQMGLDPELVSDTVGALSSFIESGGTFEIAMKPETPLVVGSVEDPSVLTKGALGWSATHSD